MTQELIMDRARIRKLLIKAKTGNMVAVLRFNIEKRMYRNKINSTKQCYYRNQITEAQGNSKKLWNLVNEITNVDKTPDTIDLIKTHNSIIKEKQEIVNEFGNYFKTAATNLTANLTTNMATSNNNYKEYLTTPTYNWGFTEVDRQDVLKIIKSLKNKKSSGYDGISNKILETIGDIISDPIAKLFNKSLETGKFPDILKVAKVIPIHKKGSKLEISNYRPISLLPTISKIWEKLLNNQITENIDDNEILPDCQFGFRKGLKTTDAVQSLIHLIQDSRRRKKMLRSIH